MERILYVKYIMTSFMSSSGKPFLIFLILLIGTLFRLPLEAQPSFTDDLPNEQLADTLIEAMTPEELLAQVFFIGYMGTEPSKFIEEWIEEKGLGGVKIFRWNVADLTSLAAGIRKMQSTAVNSRLKIPLLVAVDQEGGRWVQNVREECSVPPGNMAIGATGLPLDALNTGYYVGLELRALGINMNFAPTVDIYTDSSAAVIGSRSFSSDPVQVGVLAMAYHRGMEKAGLICTAKHYPGHGSADKDSHGFLPRVNLSFDQLWDVDLLPYRFLIREGIPAIMGGHLAFPNIIDADVPSTLSSFFLTEILRNRLNFEGVLVTDDLKMYGAHQGKLDMAAVSRQALEAGNDMILLSRPPAYQESAWNKLIDLMKRDQIFRSRIVEAVRRVLLLKLRWLKRDFPLLPDVESVGEKIPAIEAKNFFFDNSCRAVTVISNKGIPLIPGPEDRILLAGQHTNFFIEGKKRLPLAEEYEFPFFPLEWSRPIDRQRLPQITGGFDTVIFCLTSQNSLEVLNSLKDFKGELFVISTLSPGYLKQAPWITSAIAVYGLGADSFKAGFGALMGDYEAEGTLPISDR
jgi:beta-N-acetylhexosaminidase